MGEVLPLAKAAADGFRPTRPLGGWLATYGKIGPNGGVIPTTDRQGHIFEAARAIGLIDFSDYLAKGRWNDTHIGYTEETKHLPKVFVGLPTGLEFHGEHTQLAKAHKKVGFWTEGHLFDRTDPRSWTMFGDYEPTSADLARADYFWGLATMLKGMPRPLGFSAQGKLLLSPCKKRIIWAKIEHNAVCEVPQNPDASALPLHLAVPEGSFVLPEMVGAIPCADCRCPAGARCKLVDGSKGVVATSFPVVQDLEGSTGNKNQLEELIDLLVATHGIARSTAMRWARRWSSSTNTPPKETASCP